MEALKVSDHVSNWNDDRLDDLNRRVDNGFKETRDGFAKVDERFERFAKEMKDGFAMVDERFAKTPTREEMNAGFSELRASIRSLNRTLIAGAVVIIGVLIGFHG